MDTAAKVVLWGFVVGGVVAFPVVLRHVRGETSTLDLVVGIMAQTERYRARLAGSVHLTWLTVMAGAVGALLNGSVETDGGASTRIVTLFGVVFFSAGVLDLLVLLTGRPRWVISSQHRASVR